MQILGAIWLNNLGKVMNLCGSIFSVTLGFVYPYFLFRKAYEN